MPHLRCHFSKFLEDDDKTYTIWGKTLVFCTSRHRRVVMLRSIIHQQQWSLQQRIRIAEARTLIQDYPQQLQQKVCSCVNKNLGTT